VIWISIGVIDCEFFKEIVSAKEYNLMYRVKVKRKKLNKEHPNKHDKFYEKLPESEKERWGRSYMTFLDYYEIYGPK